MRELMLSPIAVVLGLIFLGVFFMIPRPDMEAEASLDTTTVTKTTVLVDGVVRSVVTINAPTIGGNRLGVDVNAPGRQGSPAYQADCMCIYSGYGNWAGWSGVNTSGSYATFNSNGQVIYPSGSHKRFDYVSCYEGSGA